MELEAIDLPGSWTWEQAEVLEMWLPWDDRDQKLQPHGCRLDPIQLTASSSRGWGLEETSAAA